MGMCYKVCEIYRNISFCRKINVECSRCAHFKKLCAAGEYCSLKGDCPELEKPNVKKTYERRAGDGKAD